MRQDRRETIYERRNAPKRTHPLRRNVIRSNPNQILIPLIRSRIKRERRLARQHFDIPCHGAEIPRQDVRGGSFESHINALAIGRLGVGVQAVGRESGGVGDGFTGDA